MQMEAKRKSLLELIPCLFYLESIEKEKVIFSILFFLWFPLSVIIENTNGAEREGEKRKEKCVGK